MDPSLLELMDSFTPKVNPDIGHGLAVKHLKYVENYVDDVMRSAASGFPKGLEYMGCARCTPQEEFNVVTRRRNNKRTLDVARSDLYYMRYNFRYNGKDLDPSYIYLPFVQECGTIMMGGSRFVISPVLSDKVISLGLTNIFVRLLRDKITFERKPHGVIIDNNREIVQVAWSLIYHKQASMKKLKPTVKAECSLMHYLLCKFGFTKTFEKFGKCHAVVGRSEINTTNYPQSDWVICQSTQIKPKGFGKFAYTATDLKVAVRREQFTPMVKSLIGGFFYVVDHFPSRMEPQWVDNTRQWTVLFGHILFTAAFSEGKLYEDVSNHFRSLDEYIDNLVLVKLKDLGHNVVDIYDLFGIIIENFDMWLLGAVQKVSSMYDKELSILYHILESINNAIFNLNFKLKIAAKKEITEKEIVNIMNSVLKTGLIFAITRQHISMSTVSYSGDNKLFKITSLLVPQATKSSGAKKTKTSINDPTKRFHVSIAEIGGYACLPKSDPTGHSRINVFVKTNDRASVLQDPDKQEILNTIQEQIRHN